LTNSWKIGAVSGLIAGIVFLIVSEIFTRIGLSIGLWDAWWRPFAVDNTIVNIPLFVFWGIVLGVIYSKVHSLIPGKGVLKGLIYGLFLFVIVTFRMETFLIPYGAVLNAVGNLFWGIFVWVAFGLSLGFVYKFLHNKYYPAKEEPKIITHDMKSGLLPGSIAGLMQGITAGFVSVIGHLTGQWGVTTGGEILPTIDFWISQFGLVPDKKIIKGIYYGLIVFLITSGQWFSWVTVWYANHNAWQFVNIMILNYFVYGFDWLIYGIVLGLLYRKPSE